MSIACTKCQTLIEETAKGCLNCGLSRESVAFKQAGENPTENMPLTGIPMALQEIKQEYWFRKKNYLGSLQYSVITTCIHLEPSYMKIVQDKKTLVIFKKRLLDAKIEYGDIHDIVIKKTIDKYDSFFAIIFCIFGIAMPIVFLLAILLFWISYGKKIHIFTVKNVYKIPTSAEFEVHELLAAIKVSNPAIFIKE